MLNENIIVVSIYIAETMLFTVTTLHTLMMVVAIGRRYPRSDGELVNDYHSTKVVSLVGFIRNLAITSSYCHVAIFYVNIIYSRIARGGKYVFIIDL